VVEHCGLAAAEDHGVDLQPRRGVQLYDEVGVNGPQRQDVQVVGIGDGDEMVAHGRANFRLHLLVKVLLKNVRLQRAAGFAGNDADSAGEVHALFDGLDLRGIGRIQYLKVRVTGGLAEGFGGDAQAEASHHQRELALAAANLMKAIPGIEIQAYFVDFEGIWDAELINSQPLKAQPATS